MALLVDERRPGEPGVHAILIGVGNYPHLRPGHRLGQFAPEVGLQDLTSPLHSVEAFAEWLSTEMRISNTPLQTLRVLGSSPTRSAQWSDSEPTFANIQRHVDDWFDDVDSHEGNLALFYYCGHGLRVGEVHALLAEDFGSSRSVPFDFAINPDLFADAMRKANARRQIFLIDACSSRVPLPRDYKKVRPRVLVQEERNDNYGLVKQSFFRASEFGTRAYGLHDGPSLFMQAFLQAMRGAGAMQRSPKDWVVKTDMLKAALNWLIQLTPEGQGQEVTYGSLSATVDFHELQGDPLIPVQVVCDPQYFEGIASLHVDQIQRCDAGKWPSSVEVALGKHNFEALELVDDSTTMHGQAMDELVHPPYGMVSIPCGDTK